MGTSLPIIRLVPIVYNWGKAKPELELNQNEFSPLTSGRIRLSARRYGLCCYA